MSNTKQKHFAFMALRKDESGQTLLSMLIALSMISLMIPFISVLIKAVNYTPTYDLTSAHHFFYVLRDEMLHNDSYHVKRNKINLHKPPNRNTTIELYGSVIRHQVNGTGHVIFMHNVNDVTFTELSYGIHVIITLNSGETYEKTIIFYK